MREKGGKRKEGGEGGMEAVDLSTGKVLVAPIAVRGQHLVFVLSFHTFQLFETGSLAVPYSIHQVSWPTKYTG